MKNTRIISMLLSAALAFTSLPIMATSVAAEEAPELEAMEKLDSIEIPTDSTTGWTGVTYEQDKYATFSLENTSGFSAITLYTTAANDTDICQPGQKYTVSIDVKVNPGFEIPADQPGISCAVSNVGTWEIWSRLTNYEWRNFTKEVNIPASPAGNVTLRVYPLRATSRVLWDFRNITITDSTGNIVLNYGEATDNWEFPVRKDTDLVSINDNSSLIADITGSNTAVSYDAEDVKLLPGVYQLTGIFSTDADTVSLSAKIGDAVMNVGSTEQTVATVGTTAQEITYTLAVAEETTLSDISFAWTTDSSSAATEIAIRDINFKCVDISGEGYVKSNIKRGTLVASGDSTAFWTTEDGTVAVDGSRNYVKCGAVGGGNNFITITLYDPADPDNSLCTLGTKYTLTFNLRQSEDTAFPDKKFGITIVDKYGQLAKNTKNNAYCDKYPLPTDDFVATSYSFTLDATETRMLKLNFMVPGGTCSDRERIHLDIRGVMLADATGEVVYARGEYDETLAPSEWTFLNKPTNEKSFTNFSELLLTPSASGSTFKYDATSRDITLEPGKYVVSAIVNAAEGSQDVKLSAKADNGETGEGLVYTIGEAKTTVKMEIEVTERTLLSEVGIDIDAGSAVYVEEFRIMKKGITFNTPNVGIIMALLIKTAGSNRGFDRTDFLEKVYEHIGGENWTYPEGRTLEIVADGDNPYLSIGSIQTNMDTFTYKYDYELEPGTYELTGSIRTAKSTETSRVRFKIGNTNVGDISFNGEWTKFKFTFDLTDFTEFSLSTYGGPWEGFKQAYQIANLSLVDLNETSETKHKLPWDTSEDSGDSNVDEPEVVEPEEDVVLAAVEGSLAPDVYNDVGSDKWVVGDQTLTVKSEEGNLYLAMRKIKKNDTGFTYNTGVTLEPGTYTLECDIRTADKGEITMVRPYVNGSVINLGFANNEWTSFDADFVVTEACELVISFSGGADASYIQDYDVTNIKVVKK